MLCVEPGFAIVMRRKANREKAARQHGPYLTLAVYVRRACLGTGRGAAHAPEAERIGDFAILDQNKSVYWGQYFYWS